MRLQHRVVDSLDAPNAPPAVILPDYDAPPRRGSLSGPPSGLRWVVAAACSLVAVAIVAMLAVPGWTLGQEIAWAIEAEAGLVRWLVRAGLIVGAVAAALALLGLARWLWLRADRAALVRLPGDAPMLVSDVRRYGAQLAAEAQRQHFEVQGRWADASLWRGTSTYAPHVVHRADRAAAGEAPPAQPAPAAPLLDAARPALAQLADKGLLRSDALLVGFDGQEAQYIDLALAGFVAIGGQARSGKTSTAIGLMAQAARDGAALIVCDPHARVAHGLLHRATALSGCFERQAVTDDEIAAAIALVAKIARRRLDGQDRADPTVLLVVDEYTALVARRALPDDVLAALLAVAVEAPKVKVHGLLLAQDWSSRLLGSQLGASLRRVVTHRIVHRCDPGNADFLLPSAAHARQVAGLQRGHALFWPADGPPGPVRVPYLADSADLTFAAGRRPPRAYVPRPAPQLAPAAPPAAPPPPLTLAARIKTLLADGQPRDSLSIARELGEDKGLVQTTLTRLAQAGDVQRAGSPRCYTYSV